jgi:hypothetical protein
MDEGLKHGSSIHCDGLVGLPKLVLTNYIGMLPAEKLAALDYALIEVKAHKMRLIIRHVLPVGLSTFILGGLWVIFTAPMAAVFLIDDAFVWSEYAKFLALAFGTSFGINVVILFPIAALGEALFKRAKHTIWAMPVGFSVAAGSILIGQAVMLDSFLGAILNWGGLLVLLSGLFMLYWLVLWLEKVALFTLVCTRVFWRK